MQELLQQVDFGELCVCVALYVSFLSRSDSFSRPTHLCSVLCDINQIERERDVLWILSLAPLCDRLLICATVSPSTHFSVSSSFTLMVFLSFFVTLTRLALLALSLSIFHSLFFPLFVCMCVRVCV